MNALVMTELIKQIQNCYIIANDTVVQVTYLRVFISTETYRGKSVFISFFNLTYIYKIQIYCNKYYLYIQTLY